MHCSRRLEGYGVPVGPLVDVNFRYFPLDRKAPANSLIRQPF